MEILHVMPHPLVPWLPYLTGHGMEWCQVAFALGVRQVCATGHLHALDSSKESPENFGSHVDAASPRASPSHDVHVDVLHMGSIFHLPAYTYVHMCVCSSYRPHWMVGLGVALKADVFDGLE